MQISNPIHISVSSKYWLTVLYYNNKIYWFSPWEHRSLRHLDDPMQKHYPLYGQFKSNATQVTIKASGPLVLVLRLTSPLQIFFVIAGAAIVTVLPNIVSKALEDWFDIFGLLLSCNSICLFHWCIIHRNDAKLTSRLLRVGGSLWTEKGGLQRCSRIKRT